MSQRSLEEIHKDLVRWDEIRSREFEICRSKIIDGCIYLSDIHEDAMIKIKDLLSEMKTHLEKRIAPEITK